MSKDEVDEHALNLGSLNDTTVESLLNIFRKVSTSNNLLVLDQNLSLFINYLIPFLTLKAKGKFSQTIWLHSSMDVEIYDQFDSILIVIQKDPRSVQYLTNILRVLPKKKVYLIVKQLDKSFTYHLNKTLGGSLIFDQINNLVENAAIRLTPALRVFNWNTEPILLDAAARLLSTQEPFGGLDSYLNQPLLQVDGLANAFISLLRSSIDLNIPSLKLKNIYGKGDHAKLLIDIIQNEKMPNFINEELKPLEQEFYFTKAEGNANLVVLERNLDYLSLVMNQVTYLGLLDDLFGIDFDTLTVNGDKYRLNDELYQELKYYNFASIGTRLNQLAKFIQGEYKTKGNPGNLEDIKKLLDNLGSLTQKEELIKKHTTLSESILNIIQHGHLNDDDSYGNFKENEIFLELENDLFELDYKTQISTLKSFLTKNFKLEIILSAVACISIVNDGIKERDISWILDHIYENFGLVAIALMDLFLHHSIIRISGSTDLFGGAFSILSNLDKQESVQNHTTTNKKLGITAGTNAISSNYALINKFWNLHPQADNNDMPQISGSLTEEYLRPFFTLPSNSVPLLLRLTESLFIRDFLEYKPVNNLSRRPNWDRLGIDTMFHGSTTDINICDRSNDKGFARSGDVEYVILIILGGITRSEIACFRYMEERFKKMGINRQFIILTPGIVNNGKLISCLNNAAQS